MDRARVVLLVRDGCHLCVDAVAIVSAVCAATGDTWATVDVDSDPVLRAEYTDHVPVTFVDGVRHALWHVDAGALAKALQQRARSVPGRRHDIGVMTEREFVVKTLPAIRMAERSTAAASQPEIGPLVGPLFDEVADALMASGAQLGLGVAYYLATDDAIECHAGFEFAGQKADGFDIGELPEESEAVALVHLGSMAGIGDSWGAVFGWLGESGLIPSGPCREVYLESPMDDQDSWVTELQQPFVRRS